MNNVIGQTVKITLDAKGADKTSFEYVIGVDSTESLNDTVKYFYTESHVWIFPNLLVRMVEIAKAGGKSEIAVPIEGYDVADIIWVEAVL